MHINIIFKRQGLAVGSVSHLCYTSDLYYLCMYSRLDSRVILDDEVPCCVADTLNRVNLRALPHSYRQWHLSLFITCSKGSLSIVNLLNQHQHRFSRLEIFTQACVLSSQYSYFILKTQFNLSDTFTLITWKYIATVDVSSISIPGSIAWKASVVLKLL